MDDFVIDGTAAFRAAATFRRLPAVVNDEFKRAADRCGVAFVTMARRRVPKKTRHLSRNIGFVTAVSDVTAVTTVFANTPYAKAQDTGSVPHVIRPKNGKALAWKGQAVFGPVLKGTKRAGGTIFARQVNHPGTKGNRFFTGSFEDLKPAFKREYAAVPRRIAAAIRGL